MVELYGVKCGIEFGNIEMEKPPPKWWLKNFYATVLRREFDIYGGVRDWNSLFQEAEASHPIGCYSMSELSKTILMNNVDYSQIMQRRIDNYHLLESQLGEIALMPALSPDAVPLGFPIRIKNRDSGRQKLFEHGIYPPVHWPIQGLVPGEFIDSHRLASEIMTLPCDKGMMRRIWSE